MKLFGMLATMAGITCLGLLNIGCEEGVTVGASLTGCPDGAVEYLVVTEGGDIEHKEGNFLELVDRNDQKLVMVDCWATWCGPCLELAPHLDAIRKDWGEKIDVVKLDVDQSPEIAAHLGVDSIPDVRIFRGGTQVGRVGGNRPAEIESLLKSLQ